MTTKIVLTKKIDLKDYTLIEGFPGIGLVGTIAAGYIVEKMKMKPVGHVYSDNFPPMTAIHDGMAYFPARIYIDSSKKICVLLAEFVVPSKIVYELADEILAFMKRNNMKQLVSLAGMSSTKTDAQKKIYGIASNTKMKDFLKSKGINMINQGITTGVSGVLLAKCAQDNFSGMSLLAEAKYGYPDPEAAATLIESLDKVINLDVETSELMKEAKVVETKMRKLVDQIRKVRGEYKKAEEEHPPMFG